VSFYLALRRFFLRQMEQPVTFSSQLLPQRRMTPTRSLAAALLVSAALAGCADEPGSSGDSGGTDAGGASSGGVAFCEALTVMRAKCQRCHQSPPQHGAPVPFLTYEDTQAQYYMTNQKWSDAMVAAVARGFMPDVAQNDPPVSLMPPVEPLTADEKTTLLDWLAQGARPEGGTDCP
jgi:uncharacterized membrane protein